MAEPDDGKLGIGGQIKGWCAVAGAFTAAAVLRWGGVHDFDYRIAVAYCAFAFGGLFALALLFHGTAFGFRVQSLLLCGAGCAGAFVFASVGLEKGWGVGSGALTFIFVVFALVKLKDVLVGRPRPPEDAG
jgi:hypothetical protein